VNSPEFASHWARELGSSEESLIQLRGGINNHVFRCGTNGHHWVVKGYAKHQTGQRDRMQAEVEFLRYAQQVASELVPSIIAVDTTRRCVVIEYIDGQAYTEGATPTERDVQTAMKFVRQLNAQLGLAEEMIHLAAAEGYLSLREHMRNVLERIDGMVTEHLPCEFRNQAKELLTQLKTKADLEGGRLEGQIASGIVQDELNSELMRISPSDFGFHNAIKTPLGVKFIDFEFSGWDDPAKACIDFVLQPRNPVRCELERMLEVFIGDRARELRARCMSLLPLLQLKWACIILGVLKAERLSSITKIESDRKATEIISKRLAIAGQLLAQT
jgi:hypothetical protein